MQRAADKNADVADESAYIHACIRIPLEHSLHACMHGSRCIFLKAGKTTCMYVNNGVPLHHCISVHKPSTGICLPVLET